MTPWEERHTAAAPSSAPLSAPLPGSAGSPGDPDEPVLLDHVADDEEVFAELMAGMVHRGMSLAEANRLMDRLAGRRGGSPMPESGREPARRGPFDSPAWISIEVAPEKKDGSVEGEPVWQTLSPKEQRRQREAEEKAAARQAKHEGKKPPKKARRRLGPLLILIAAVLITYLLARNRADKKLAPPPPTPRQRLEHMETPPSPPDSGDGWRHRTVQ